MNTNCPDNSNNGSGPRIYFDSLIIDKEYIIKQIEVYTPYYGPDYGPQENYNNYFYVKLVEKTASTAKFELFCSKDEGGSWSENEVLEPNGSDAFIEFTREDINNEVMTEDGLTAQIYDALPQAAAIPQLSPQSSQNSFNYGTSNNNNYDNPISGGRRRRKTKKAIRRSKKRTIRRRRRRYQAT